MENQAILKIKNAPKTPGVYKFLNKSREVIYVGKAINLQSRLKSYLDNYQNLKTTLLIENIFDVSVIKVFSEFEALILEAELIKKFQPKYNLISKDGKSYLYIAATKEEFPKIFACRKKEINNPKFLFGPFPSSSTVNKVLKFLRKIYPFCQQKTNSRPCFWSHLGLCNPCPGKIIHEINKIKRLKRKREYLQNIKSIEKILSGKSNRLINQLEKMMKKESLKQNFEQAAIIKKRIDQLSYLTLPQTSIGSYLENANFYEEKQKEELEELTKILNDMGNVKGEIPIKRSHIAYQNPASHFSSPTSLDRIECYDISNLSGQFAVGSMVVFTNGVSDKSQYRRFKIKKADKPNDVAMIEEMLIRRLKHEDWSNPNLIIVDGGKPQIRACYNALVHCNKEIPFIGLAKRLETIVLPNKKEISLPINSPALNLLRRIRDETHRFAISYHRKLRKKSFLID